MPALPGSLCDLEDRDRIQNGGDNIAFNLPRCASVGATAPENRRPTAICLHVDSELKPRTSLTSRSKCVAREYPNKLDTR